MTLSDLLIPVQLQVEGNVGAVFATQNVGTRKMHQVLFYQRQNGKLWKIYILKLLHRYDAELLAQRWLDYNCNDSKRKTKLYDSIKVTLYIYILLVKDTFLYSAVSSP